MPDEEGTAIERFPSGQQAAGPDPGFSLDFTLTFFAGVLFSCLNTFLQQNITRLLRVLSFPGFSACQGYTEDWEHLGGKNDSPFPFSLHLKMLCWARIDKVSESPRVLRPGKIFESFGELVCKEDWAVVQIPGTQQGPGKGFGCGGWLENLIPVPRAFECL